MECTLLICRKAFSFAESKPIVEWHEQPYELDIELPSEFYVKAVDAGLLNKDLGKEFPELTEKLEYHCKPNVIDAAKRVWRVGFGICSIAVVFNDVDVAYLISKSSGLQIDYWHGKLVNAHGVNDVKEMTSEST